jgi:hypothetical protein
MRARVRRIVAAFDWAGGVVGTEDAARSGRACLPSASSYREPRGVARDGELASGDEHGAARLSADANLLGYETRVWLAVHRSLLEEF